MTEDRPDAVRLLARVLIIGSVALSAAIGILLAAIVLGLAARVFLFLAGI